MNVGWLTKVHLIFAFLLCCKATSIASGTNKRAIAPLNSPKITLCVISFTSILTLFSSAFPLVFKNITGILHWAKVIVFSLVFFISLWYSLVETGFCSVPRLITVYPTPIPAKLPFRLILKFNILLLFFISLPWTWKSLPSGNFLTKVCFLLPIIDPSDVWIVSKRDPLYILKSNNCCFSKK